MLRQLKKTEPAKAGTFEPHWITTESWSSFWKTAKERTSSGPSNLHFGIWKAGAHSQLISDIDAIMTNVLMQAGYSPARWQKGLDVMLLKKPGVLLLEKHWTILLFEANFNYMNKIIE